MLLKNKTFPSRSGLVSLLAIVAGVVISSSLIIIPSPQSKLRTLFSNWTINASAISAFIMSSLSTITARRTYKIQSKGNDKNKQRDNEYISLIVQNVVFIRIRVTYNRNISMVVSRTDLVVLSAGNWY